jgi:xanthine dehydrogenase accessory factor
MLTITLQKKADELAAEGETLAVATVVRVESPTSSKPGARALITKDGQIHGWIGGGCAQPAVIRAAKRVIDRGEPEFVRVTPEVENVTEIGLTAHKSSCKSGGVLDIFIEPFLNRIPLLVIGSSPCAISIAQFASSLEFEVTLAANDELPQIDGVSIHKGFDLSNLNFNRLPYVVVATQGRGDKAALIAASHIPSNIFGFVASSKKSTALRNEIISSNEAGSGIEQLIAPFGIDMVVKSPQEIAISVIAQLIDHRNGNLNTIRSEQSVADYESVKIDKPTVKSCCGG